MRGSGGARTIGGVRRYSVLLAVLMVLILAAVPRLRALTDDEKRALFLQARGDEGGTPAPSPSPHRKQQPEESPTPRRKRSPTPAQDDTREEPAGTPRVALPSEDHPARTPAPPDESVPKAVPAPTPPPSPMGAQVDIQKQGLEEAGGFVPPPLPPPARHHWWQIFGGGGEQQQYHYLTPAIRDAIDRAPVARQRWRYIVVHNSGTRQGNAKIFDYYHRYVRKMPNGLAYHFVIGNGTSSGNGQIEIGSRWTKQLQGGHVHSDYLNNIALGICLVGDFNRDLPTKEQLEALDELITYLRARVGKIDRQQAIVKAHREINPPQWPTDCPGDRFPYHWLHARFD